ncbi:MAG: phosphatase PAP2 family protein [Chitinophagaceae bacterium]|nr:phosphatase PAP2 family protein [Chitinophagaceae bacterium]
MLKEKSYSGSLADTGRIRIMQAKNALPVKSLILPAAMISFGAISLNNKGLKTINHKIREELWIEEPHKKAGVDNFLQFSPAIAVYALNIAGVKGKNNLRDRTMIYTLSNLIMSSSVFALKRITHEQRPDGSDYLSFPSGHTATAFAAAEFMRQEYKDVSPWYGIAGYAAASATGYLRMYNNKHWLGDVVAGAGIGILSTRAAYWLYPAIKRKLFHDKPVNSMLMPYYQPGKGAGLSFVMKLQ